MLPATRARRHAGDATFAEGYMAVIATEIRNAARSLSRSPTVTACAMAAAVIPAVRASRVNPIVAIQTE